MAFVFRSQKKNSILVTSEDAQSTIDEQKLKRIHKSPGNLARGLPSIINKTENSMQKQNILPQVEAHVIHRNESLITKNNCFRGRQFIDTQVNVGLNQEADVGEIITVKKIQNQSFIQVGGDKGERKHEQVQRLKFKSPQKPKKVEVMNKNLLEILLLRQKNKKNVEFQKIGINKKDEKGDQISKNNKFAQWKSLKKLSPMKIFQHKIDKNSLQNLNIECKKSQETIQLIKTNKKIQQRNRPLDLMNKQLKTESSSDEEQYVDQATPGPGYYSIQNWKEKKQFRSKKKKFQKLFFSNLDRFQKSPNKFQQVTYVNEDQTANNSSFNHKKSSQCQSFLSKSPKLSNTQVSCIPPIGYYDTRQSLEHDLVRNILKSSNTNTFISRSPRRYQISGTNLPGPGAYTLDQSYQKLLQQKNLCTFSYKSNLQRKLDYHTTENKDQENKGLGLTSMYIGKNKQESLIHAKQDSIIEDLYITQQPPFMSSSDRFPKIKIINKKMFEKSPTPIEKPISPKKPFNSSSQRKIDHIIGEGVGVGAYNNPKPQWQKRSFNVLFN